MGAAQPFVKSLGLMVDIRSMNIRRTDLNLLAVFEVLMQERNVTRAAGRLGLSQPAVSAALGRLRKNLGDALLVRSGHGMRPTPRAEQLGLSISQALDSMERALQLGATFVPAKARRSFTLMLSDIGEVTYLPIMVARLQRDAPGVTLSIRRLSRSLMADELGIGSVDLALGWVDRPLDDLRRHRLFDETFVCILRKEHPRIGRRLALARFAAEWHLVVGQHEYRSENVFRSLDGKLVRELAAKSVARKVALQVPDFLAVPNIIANTDLLCVVPRRLAEVYAAYGKVRFVPLPVNCGSFPVLQFWHKRFDHDEGNAWLRNLIIQIFGEADDNGRTRKHIER
jgi:DNA-binding transcriptional LysR family regulator